MFRILVLVLLGHGLLTQDHEVPVSSKILVGISVSTDPPEKSITVFMPAQSKCIDARPLLCAPTGSVGWDDGGWYSEILQH